MVKVYWCENGRVTLKVVNASAGGPVKDVRVLGGLFEGRATPITTTNAKGVATARMAGGTYTLTLQAPGFGIQRIKVPVAKGRSVARTIKLRPNLLSESSGAKVVSTSSESDALPATNAFDDTEATAWRTEEVDAARQPSGGDDVDRRRPEDVSGQLLQYESDAERDEQSVQRSVVHPLDEGDLEQDAHGAADEESDDQRDEQ